MLFGRRAEEASFFERQQQEARQALETAEEALIAFQADNKATILSNQLNSVRQNQVDYLADQRNIARIIQDIQGLRAQLSSQSSSRVASLGDELTALFLEVKAFNAQSSIPVQLQLTDMEALSGTTAAEQIVFLDDLVTNLRTRSEAIDARLAELEPEILSLQEAVQAIHTQQERLNRDRDIARETYMTLANKVEEARIAAQDEAGEVRLASRAATPTQPAGPRKMMNVAIAAFLGLFLGVLLAFFVEYWQTSHVSSVETTIGSSVKEQAP
jgi:uncharacterized protein involved in exopolysaccharide biosynthesis